MVNSKNAFWQAFIITIFVFIAGLVLGFYIELSHANKSDYLVRSYEADFLDQQMKLAMLGNNLDCEEAKNNLFEFADEIYYDALKFEEQDEQSKLTTDQRGIIHKRYDLLRLNLWIESSKLREKCGNETFHTVLYLFEYNTDNVEIRSEQRVLGLVLMDLKYKYSNQILLLPIASNLDLDSIEMVKKSYNITYSPSLLIDESLIVDSLSTLEELEYKIFKTNPNQKIIFLRP